MILLQANKTIHCVNHYINSLIYLPKINRIVALITRTNDCNVSVYMTAAKPSGNKINCKNKSLFLLFKYDYISNNVPTNYCLFSKLNKQSKYWWNGFAFFLAERN